MKKLIIANWKMNPISLKEAESLFNSFKKEIKNIKDIEIVICPPFIYLSDLKLKNLKLGAQNCFWKNQGAYTGEISPLMLKDLGVEYVIIGHSERRNYLGETDEMINKKLLAALESGLKVILCIGETLEQKKGGIQKKVVQKQLNLDLKEIKNLKFKIKNLVVAYEPVWAIGTGNYCQPEEALEMINFIKLKTKSLKLKTKVLYGGSVDAKNVAGYVKYPEIDGALVGGASLNPTEFKKIINKIINEVSKSLKT